MNVQKTWFCSDHHFGHSNVIKHCNRPFRDIEEHDQKLVEYHNELVHPRDLVYFVGDVSLSKEKHAIEMVNRMHGHKILVRGNHDRKNKYGNAFERIVDYLEIDLPDIDGVRTKVVLSHYPMLSWNKHHRGSWHVHGHCHGTMAMANPEYYTRKVIDAGVDCWNMRPIEAGEVARIMSNRIIKTVDHHQGEYE